MNIRLATEADAAELARLMELFDNPPRSAELQAQMMQATAEYDHTFLACDGEMPIGFAVLRFLARADIPPGSVYAEVSDLFVEHAHRGKGIGRALLRRCESLARELGASGLWLITGFENKTAQAMYRSEELTDWALAMKKVF